MLRSDGILVPRGAQPEALARRRPETDPPPGRSEAWLIWRVVLRLIEQAAELFLDRQRRVEDRHLQDDASVVSPALRAEQADQRYPPPVERPGILLIAF